MGKATCENSSFAHLYSSDPTIGCRYSKLCNWNFFRACSSAGIVFRTGCFPMKEPGLSTVTCPSPCHANLQKKKRESSLSQGMLLHQMLMTPAITINLKLRLTSICKNLKGVGMETLRFSVGIVLWSSLAAPLLVRVYVRTPLVPLRSQSGGNHVGDLQISNVLFLQTGGICNNQ